MTTLEQIDRVIAEHQVRLVDGTWLDVQTARAIRMVYDALKPENQEKYLRMGIVKMANFAWKQVKVGG